NLAYNSLTSRIVNQVRSRQQQGLKDYVSGLIEQWGKLPDDQATDALQWALKDNFNTLIKAPMNVAMEDLRQSLPGRVVNAVPLLRDLRAPNSKVTSNILTLLKKEREQDPATFDHLINLLSPEKGSAGQAPPNLTLDEAMRLKTVLSQYGEKKFPDAAGQTLATSAGIFAKKLEQQIKTALDGVPSLLRSYETSQQMYAEGMKLYKNDLIEGVTRTLATKPGALSSVLLKENNVDTVKAVRAAVGDDFWKQIVEPRVGATLLYKSFGEMGQGTLSGTALANRLQSLATDGTAQSLFTPDTYKKLLSLAQTIEHVSRPPKGAGSVLIQLTQAGAVGAVAGGAMSLATGDVQEGVATGLAGATLVLLSPAMLGKLVADPKYIESFKAGLSQSSSQRKPAGLLLTALRQLATTETAQHALLKKDEPTMPVETPAPGAATRPELQVQAN
ncbi:MAG: hypothetical protein KGI70_03505, partial [Patescibacteria group bacterium]|nr:hypothetical protein [Patescibacteria group bacterium]